MTDQIPADKVREIATAMRASMRRVEDGYPDGEFLMDMSHYIRDLDALLPAPKRPTLAGMTMTERLACQWMQADVKGGARRVVIVNPHWEEGSARVLCPSTRMREVPWESVTPRPDLPRMAWPGNQKPAPVPALPDGWRLADHPDHGRVLVVRVSGENAIYATPYKATGIRTRACLASDLTFLDAEDQAMESTDATD